VSLVRIGVENVGMGMGRLVGTNKSNLRFSGIRGLAMIRDILDRWQWSVRTCMLVCGERVWMERKFWLIYNYFTS
jgi:hypothetical protein